MQQNHFNLIELLVSFKEEVDMEGGANLVCELMGEEERTLLENGEGLTLDTVDIVL